MRRQISIIVLIAFLSGLVGSIDNYAADALELTLTGYTDFGKIHVLGSSTTGYVRVTNSGTGAVTLSKGSLTGASEFVLTNEPQFPITLQPEQYMLWNFRFFPQDPGERTAQISVTSDATGSPHSITLRAEAVDTPLGPWEWEFVGRPLGTTEINSIFVDQEDDKLWYVTTNTGLLITRDGGNTWQQSLSGGLMHSHALAFDPTNSNRLYAAITNKLYVSSDKGLTWALQYTFPVGNSLTSLTVGSDDGVIYVPSKLGTDGDIMNPGIYISHDSGETWDFNSFNFSENGLIAWHIVQDPISHVLYIATEISDHPQPYNPPFFRSRDNGLTWEDVSGTLPWHGVVIQVDPPKQHVYFLTEGAGLYRSSDEGQNWQYLSNYFWLELLLDPDRTNRLYGGAHVYGSGDGGAFVSNDAGLGFERIGLSDLVVGSLTLNGSGSKLYAASYGAGIFMTPVPKEFSINAGLNDSWYYKPTSGQGFFITVFSDLGKVSLAWFTFDTELPPIDAVANLGDPGHRWLTALGDIDGNQVVMNVTLTSGGIFDTPGGIERTDPPGSDGTIILTFDSCNSGTVEYDITSINRQGIVPIERVVDDNIVLCEALQTD